MLWKSHTLSQRQWKGELPCVQITGYASVYKSDTYSGVFSQ